MNQTPIAVSEFQRDGFLVVRQFLATEALQELQTELDRYIRLVVPGLEAAHAFYQEPGNPASLKQLQHMGQDPFFAAYRQRPAWTGLATTLLGEPVEASEPEWFNKPPGSEHATPPHQDNYYFNWTPPQVVTIWVALDPVDDENGCLKYLPGSHRQPVRPHGASRVLGFSQGILDYSQADRQREVAVHLQPGDAVVHHGNTVHRADANRSSHRHRRAFAMVLQGVSCRRDEAAYARYLEALQRQHEDLAQT